MKFLCPACERLADIAAFRVERGALTLRCARCGVESAQEGEREDAPAAVSGSASPSLVSVKSSEPPPPAEPKLVLLRAATAEGVTMPAAVDHPFDAPPGFCPKCVAPRGAGPSCTQCGLVFSVFRAEDARPPEPVAEAFQVLLGAWQDEAAHDRFLQHVVTLHALPAAARLYRIQLAYNPEDPFAARGKQEIVRLVTASHPFAVAAPPPAGRALKPWQVGLALLGLALFLLTLVSLLRGMVAVGP